MDAAEEAILNSLFWAERVKGKDDRVAEAFPLERVRKLLFSHGLLEDSSSSRPLGNAFHINLTR